ncbi:hypothetical protein [Pseudoxanthomonas sp. Root630]|uniref:AbiTii domain-containing protein n=1 Tax=Pseudoxanthomonas sp. Root630 TaxID=1736574 RepID=UPI0007026F54|nr:hypothetical protein [Pseudoxanthomonas sp. Root630]KRA44586.1 hypothetical protein ASD72_11440 [Pseudoxanthomonas sp. Root630]
MAEIVIDLQGAALDSSVPIADLLRKALLVSRKLGVRDIEEWLNWELHRYPSGEQLPDYRKVRGRLHARDEDGDLIPVQFREPMDYAERASVVQSVAELEEVAAAAKGGFVNLSLSHTLQKIMREATNQGPGVEFILEISASKYVQVLSAVRTRVLNWALALEEQGILGAGMTFSTKEITAAHQITYDYSTHIGAMHNSQLQQNSSGQQILISGPDLVELRALMEEVVARSNELGANALVAVGDAQTVIAQLDSGQPKAVVLRECLTSLRSIMEGAGGAFLAAEILPKLIPIVESLRNTLLP